MKIAQQQADAVIVATTRAQVVLVFQFTSLPRLVVRLQNSNRRATVWQLAVQLRVHEPTANDNWQPPTKELGIFWSRNGEKVGWNSTQRNNNMYVRMYLCWQYVA